MIQLFGKDISEGKGFDYFPFALTWGAKSPRRFISKVLRTAVCRMMEKEKEEKAQKRPFKTEQQVIDELTQLGIPVPK
jgi:hypothetical protein